MKGVSCVLLVRAGELAFALVPCHVTAKDGETKVRMVNGAKEEGKEVEEGEGDEEDKEEEGISNNY